MEQKSESIIKIILVDDHKIMREGLRVLLENSGMVQIIAEAKNGKQAIELADSINPEIILMDVAMPEMNGIEATKRITASHPEIKIIALSMHIDTVFIQKMLEAGVRGYLLKDCAADELMTAIDLVHQGKTYLSKQIRSLFDIDHIGAPKVSVLSSREREVLQLIAEGFSTREIGQKLFISIKTVESHRHNIMHKLAIYTVASLTKYAIRNGLTGVEQ